MGKCDTCAHKMFENTYNRKILCAVFGKMMKPEAECEKYKAKEQAVRADLLAWSEG